MVERVVELEADGRAGGNESGRRGGRGRVTGNTGGGDGRHRAVVGRLANGGRCGRGPRNERRPDICVQWWCV